MPDPLGFNLPYLGHVDCSRCDLRLPEHQADEKTRRAHHREHEQEAREQAKLEARQQIAESKKRLRQINRLRRESSAA